MIWRWCHSFRPCCGMAKSVSQELGGIHQKFTFNCSTSSEAHYPERKTSVLRSWNGVFTSRFVVSCCCFPAKFRSDSQSQAIEWWTFCYYVAGCGEWTFDILLLMREKMECYFSLKRNSIGDHRLFDVWHLDMSSASWQNNDRQWQNALIFFQTKQLQI